MEDKHFADDRQFLADLAAETQHSAVDAAVQQVGFCTREMETHAGALGHHEVLVLGRKRVSPKPA